MHWNESDEETPRLIKELKEATRKDGLSVPGEGDYTVNILVSSDHVIGSKFSDYYHLYVKYLRGGGMDVATSLLVIKSLIREYRDDSLTKAANSCVSIILSSVTLKLLYEPFMAILCAMG